MSTIPPPPVPQQPATAAPTKTYHHPIPSKYISQGLDPAFITHWNTYELHAPQSTELSIEFFRSLPPPAPDALPPGRDPGPAFAADKISDFTVAVEGGEVEVRMYEPDEDGEKGELRPVYIHYHGGGWILGGGHVVDAPFCKRLVKETGCVAFDVDYRLAPEHPFPVPVTDAFAALKYIIENSATLRIDPHRVTVGGASAGAHLAAVCTLLARADSSLPPLAGQLLCVPAVDLTTSDPSGAAAASPTNPYASWRDNADSPSLFLEDLCWYQSLFLGTPRPEGWETDWRISPMKAPVEMLKGLPPALIVTAQFDMLRDEGRAYAGRLEREGGVKVRYKCMAGVPHLFPLLDGVLEAGKEWNELSVGFLKEVFGDAGGSK